MAQIVDHLGMRAGEEAVLVGKINGEPIGVALLLEEEAKQAGGGDLARIAAGIELACELEKALGLGGLVCTDGGPAAARRGCRLDRRIGGQGNGLQPEAERLGRMVFGILQLSQRLRGIAREVAGRLLLDEQLEEQAPLLLLAGDDERTGKKVLGRLLDLAVALVGHIFERGNGVGEFALIEENGAPAELGVGAERTLRVGIDLIGVGGEGIRETAHVAVRFGEPVERLLATTVVGEIANEFGERGDGIDVLLGGEERHGGIESDGGGCGDDDIVGVGRGGSQLRGCGGRNHGRWGGTNRAGDGCRPGNDRRGPDGLDHRGGCRRGFDCRGDRRCRGWLDRQRHGGSRRHRRRRGNRRIQRQRDWRRRGHGSGRRDGRRIGLNRQRYRRGGRDRFRAGDGDFGFLGGEGRHGQRESQREGACSCGAFQSPRYQVVLGNVPVPATLLPRAGRKCLG